MLGCAAAAVPRPAGADVLTVFPLTAAEARELASLLESPDQATADLADAAGAIGETLPSLPAALVHDLATLPSRHLHILHALVMDVLEVAAVPAERSGGLLGRTVRALYRSATFDKAASAFRRVTRADNRTARLAIVLTARAHGVPVELTDLEAVRQAIDRDAPDVAPLLARALQRLGQAYGREAVRALVTW